MTIDTNAVFSATEANQNFSKVARMAEKMGHVVVFKHNRPKLLVIDLDTEPQIEMTEDEKIDFVAARLQSAFCANIERHSRSWQNDQVLKGKGPSATKIQRY